MHMALEEHILLNLLRPYQSLFSDISVRLLKIKALEVF
jgi:hypothetical protein